MPDNKQTSDPGSPPALDEAGRLTVPCELGHYRVTAMLGAGGMGSVYLADEPALNRKVALKVLHPELARDVSYVRRFQQEAQSAARLSHPGIVSVHYIGRVGEIVFFAMEHVEGETVGARLKRLGRLGLADALSIARQVSEALEYAQEMSVIHRDIKPSNLFINDKGRLKIGDFGLAKRSDVDLSLTQTGAVIGSPYYMSPEQARSGDVDRRSDIYSLGATLYHLVSGHPPFEADSPVAVLISHAQDEVTPVEDFVSPIRERFHKLVSLMMAKSPDDRLQSHAEVVVALDELRDVLAMAGDELMLTAETETASPEEGTPDDEPALRLVDEADVPVEAPVSAEASEPDAEPTVWPEIALPPPPVARPSAPVAASGRGKRRLAVCLMLVLGGLLAIGALKTAKRRQAQRDRAAANAGDTTRDSDGSNADEASPSPTSDATPTAERDDALALPGRGGGRGPKRSGKRDGGRFGAYLYGLRGSSAPEGAAAPEQLEALATTLREQIGPDLRTYDFQSARLKTNRMLDKASGPGATQALRPTVTLLAALCEMEKALIASIGEEGQAETTLELSQGAIHLKDADEDGFTYTAVGGSSVPRTTRWEDLPAQTYYDMIEAVLPDGGPKGIGPKPAVRKAGYLLAFAWIYDLSHEIQGVVERAVAASGLPMPDDPASIQADGDLFRRLFMNRSGPTTTGRSPRRRPFNTP